jgi:DMSO/TMAO reductase YedYZ molybdopterin-dependent catalytic subunit
MNRKRIPRLISRIFIALMLVLTLAACRQPFTPPPGETEATEYLGVKLTSINAQRNNALAGTQIINKDTYTLTVDGLVNKSLTLTYGDLQAYPQISKLATLPCVEGWSFIAKWAGPALASILNDTGVKPEAKILIFYTADSTSGYTSLDLSYIQEKSVIIALRLNDITLPQDRGFPFQVVAEGKLGYKWAKWVTRIELSDNENFRGYWESRGYSNSANAN